jgi:hypothetical protein
MAAAFSTSLRNAMSRVFFFKFINKNIRKRESISKIRRYENLNLFSNQTWGYLLDKMKKKKDFETIYLRFKCQPSTSGPKCLNNSFMQSNSIDVRMLQYLNLRIVT